MSSSKAIIYGHGSSPEAATDPDLAGLKDINIFNRGVVIDTICDVATRQQPPDTLSDTQKSIFSLAPRNSIICRIITTGESRNENSDIVCFPFFSSHFALPVKPGEQVWIFRANALSDSLDSRSYWMSRVSDVLAIEDANFSPFTRAHSITQTKPLSPDRLLSFPNGDSDAANGNIITGDETALQELVTNSTESRQVVLEPVPRLTKRPGDLVLQGSNNTTIILGTDRGWDADDRPNKPNSSNSTPTAEISKKSGAVDLVAGRGRYFDTSQNETLRKRKLANEAKGVTNSTQPFVAINSFNEFETDKDPGQTQDIDENTTVNGEGLPTPGNARTNPAEGDPDFLVDAARVYIAENTQIDQRLGLDRIVPSSFETPYQPQAGPTVAVKADHIRIVARKMKIQATTGLLPEKFEDTAGSIRIVKEGDNDNDLAVIMIEADGTIQISGPKIFLGRTTEDGGAGEGPGPGGAQPYVKYKQLEDLWIETMDTIESFCDTILTHVTPGYGAPSPQLNQAAAEMKTKIAGKLKKNIENIKSTRIFGE